MLLQISVINFAVFNNETIDLYKGLSVITGESGAGKSVLINALSLINGSRAYKEMIRKDCEYALVKAVFKLDKKQKELINEMISIDMNDENLVITRKIYLNQKSECRINGSINNLSILTKISALLLDIHGQYENQALLDVSKHITFIDTYADKQLKKVMYEYNLRLHKYNNLVNKVSSISGTLNERQRDKEIFRFQIDDINNSLVLEYDWNEVFNKKKIMDNYENIKIKLTDSIRLLDNDKFSVCDNIYDAAKLIESTIKESKSISEELLNSYYQISDNIKNINKLIIDLEFDENEQENNNDIVDSIIKIKSKYGETKEEVINFLNDINKKLENIDNFEKNQEKDLISIRTYEKLLIKDIETIRSIRKNYATELEKEVKRQINELEMKNAKFSVRFQEIREKNILGFQKFYVNGNDILEFYVSTLKEGELMPLKRIASGGEMSRIMLALKTIIADKDNINTVIFDEIDIGISGQTAKIVANKLGSLSKDKQVICITHSPQIIAKGDNHYVITKNDDYKSTMANIIYLDDSSKRIYELAKIIDGNIVTENGLAHAKELINN